MYSSADVTVTPRPMYPADGRKLPDCYTQPGDLRDDLQAELGQFPLFKFWGPGASIDATRWIAEAAMRVEARFDPTLSLVYLPHLDYGLQKHGPRARRHRARTRRAGRRRGRPDRLLRGPRRTVIVLSEYGIVPVSRPVHLNRVLRAAGLIGVREELGRELLDAGGSEAFAVADHQIAHVYVNDPARIGEVQRLLESTRRRRRGARRRRQARATARPPALGRAGAASPSRTRGSPTTTGSTTRRRPTTRGRSTSTASPATTRSSCSSTPRSACRRWPWARASSAASSASAR